MGEEHARGHCSATVVKVLDIGNQSVAQRLVLAKIRTGVRRHQWSSQKKTRAMVAQSDEEGEKAFTCVEVKGTRSKRNLKKSGTEGLTNSGRVVYIAACHAQSNDGQNYIGEGKFNGRPVKVLRDTGCTGMIVDRALVPDVMVIPGSLQMVDHTLIDVPLASRTTKDTAG